MTSLKAAIRDLLQRPTRIKSYGKNVSFARPRKVVGPENIEIGDFVTIRNHAFFNTISERGAQSFSPRLLIEGNVYIGSHAHLVCAHSITIESNCVLSDHIYIADIEHSVDPLAGPILNQPLVSKGPVKIGKGSFIGYRSFICSGVSLGNNCVVAAHSVVTRSYPARVLLAGNPARVVKSFCEARKMWINA
jgi:acetyltransferase-like isoleucine patch superfamily enzyme